MCKIRGVFIDSELRTAQEVSIEAGLDSYYELLKCNTIDIVDRKIGGDHFDIICDDEGMFKDQPIVTMCSLVPLAPMLVGNLFICKHDGEGNETSLTDFEVSRVLVNFVCGMLWGGY